MRFVALKFFGCLQRLLEGEKGQDMAEYALMVALIALIAVSAVRNLGDGIAAGYEYVAATFSSDL